MNNQEKHYINRSGWLRAGVLGANDGILSTASIIIGVGIAFCSFEFHINGFTIKPEEISFRFFK